MVIFFSFLCTTQNKIACSNCFACSDSLFGGGSMCIVNNVLKFILLVTKLTLLLSPVHTSDADEPPTVGGTHFDAYEYLTCSYSGV